MCPGVKGLGSPWLQKRAPASELALRLSSWSGIKLCHSSSASKLMPVSALFSSDKCLFDSSMYTLSHHQALGQYMFFVLTLAHIPNSLLQSLQESQVGLCLQSQCVSAPHLLWALRDGTLKGPSVVIDNTSTPAALCLGKAVFQGGWRSPHGFSVVPKASGTGLFFRNLIHHLFFYIFIKHYWVWPGAINPFLWLCQLLPNFFLKPTCSDF